MTGETLPGPLSGVRVVELATVLMAPYAAQILGDLGADVIKVEGARTDAGRVLGGNLHPELSGAALNLQRNKRSIRLDLKQPDGLAALRALLDTADVFLTNVRPAALARLGLDPTTLVAAHPGLVVADAHGFRADSPDADRPAFDDVIQAETGLPRLIERVTGTTAFAPTVVADKVSGLYLVIGVLAALHERAGSGVGQRVEVAMFDAVVNFLLVEHLAGAAVEGGAAGYVRILSRFRGPHRTRDGFVAALPYSDEHWQALYDEVGRAGELAAPHFADLRARIDHADLVYGSLAAVMAERTTGEWLELCHRIGVPAAAVPTIDELVADPARHRGVIRDAVHPVIGPYRQLGPALHFSRTPVSVRRPAPLIGEHTIEVLRELGFDQADVDALLASRAARQSGR